MPDEITNFEICGFHKNTEIEISREKKRYFLRIKGYFIAWNSFVVEVTFNTRNRELNFKNNLWALCSVSLFNIFSGYLHFDALIIDALIRGSLRFT